MIQFYKSVLMRTGYQGTRAVTAEVLLSTSCAVRIVRDSLLYGPTPWEVDLRYVVIHGIGRLPWISLIG